MGGERPGRVIAEARDASILGGLRFRKAGSECKADMMRSGVGIFVGRSQITGLCPKLKQGGLLLRALVVMLCWERRN